MNFYFDRCGYVPICTYLGTEGYIYHLEILFSSFAKIHTLIVVLDDNLWIAYHTKRKSFRDKVSRSGSKTNSNLHKNMRGSARMKLLNTLPVGT